jgi:hypothetical protein
MPQARKSLRILGRIFCGIAGVACLAAVPIMVYCCLVIVFVAGSGERFAIDQTGLPASHKLLTWSEWHDGRDGLSAFDGNYNRGRIIAYRIGAAQGLLTEFTFYQAKYETAGGEIEIGPANGPKPLIAVMTYRVAAVAVTSVLGGIAFLWLAFRGIHSSRGCG